MSRGAFTSAVGLIFLLPMLSPAPAPRSDAAEGGAVSATRAPARLDGHLVREIAPAHLESGDLLFRSGQSRESRLVMLFDGGVPYSHVGLVDKAEDGAAYVIHVVPGAAEAGLDRVRREPLADFLAPEAAAVAAVYRLRSPHRPLAPHAAEVARGYHAARLPFDGAFDSASADALYCTELVWRAYREAGLDLVDGVLEPRAFRPAAETYVLPSALLESPYLAEVHRSSP